MRCSAAQLRVLPQACLHDSLLVAVWQAPSPGDEVPTSSWPLSGAGGLAQSGGMLHRVPGLFNTYMPVLERTLLHKHKGWMPSDKQADAVQMIRSMADLPEFKSSMHPKGATAAWNY